MHVFVWHALLRIGVLIAATNSPATTFSVISRVSDKDEDGFAPG